VAVPPVRALRPVAAVGMRLSTEKNVYMARLAGQAERYEEMCGHMKEVALEMEPLGLEERNLLSVAYKNVVGARRSSLRTLAGLEKRERERQQAGDETADQRLIWLASYRSRIEDELEEVCTDILGLIDSRLIPANPGLRAQQEQEDPESQVFYQKMRADYFRYLAELRNVKSIGEGAPAANAVAYRAEASYKAASELAQTGLPPTHPIRLGLALNYAVFLHEVLGQSPEACERAKQAIDDAIAELDCAASLDAASYRDSTLIMQLLRDNLTLWAEDRGAG